MLKVGDKAPDFRLAASGGEIVSLKDLKGKKIVLYFYPKDDTSGCTKEACSFQDNRDRIKKKGAIIIGVSADSIASHEKFAQKYGLDFPLLSDEKREVIKKYGVWKEKSMYGKKYMGIERTTFVIDEKGEIQYIVPKVKVDGHVQKILGVL
jgi:peroxiredoxin Q/BCP